jgi:Tfp pilus assembly protein PilN
LFTRATALDLEGISPDVAQRKLDEEVARSFTAYQNEYRSKIIGHVFLSGSSATVKDAGRLERSLSSILEMPVSRLHNRLIAANDPDLIGYATASGLALQTQSSALAPISLVPDERAERQARQATRLKQQVSILGAAAVLIGALWQANAMVKNNAAEAVRTKAANDKLKSSKTILATVQKKHDMLASLNSELEKGLDRKHGAVDVVTALHAALPDSADLWLTQLSYVHGGLLTLRGEARNSTAPTELVIALQGSGAFRDVKLVYMGDAQETNLVATAPKTDDTKSASPLPNFGDAGAQTGGAAGFTPAGSAGGFTPGGGASGSQGGGQPGSGNPGFSFPGAGGGGNFPTNGGGGGGFTPGRQPNIITPGQLPGGFQGGGASGNFQVPQGANVIVPDAPGPAVTGEGTTPGPRRRQRANRMSSRFSGGTASSEAATLTGTKPAVTPAASVSSNITTRRARVATRPGVGGKVTRTSFIITCHVNQGSIDLLMGLNLTTKKSDQTAGPSSLKTRKRVVGEGQTDDSGDNDAD